MVRTYDMWMDGWMDGNTPLVGLNICRFGACSYRGGRLLILLLSFFIYPLCGPLADMSWRVVSLCLRTFTTHSLPLFFSIFFQQVHYGRLHEKLRLIRTMGTDETTLGVPALPNFLLSIWGIFSSLIACLATRRRITYLTWRFGGSAQMGVGPEDKTTVLLEDDDEC